MSPSYGGWGGRYVWRTFYGESRPFWTQGGDSFPGYTAAKTADKLTIFDLSKNPPEKKELPPADVSRSGNDKWKHPPAVAKMEGQDFADIIAYIRFAANGSKKTVEPSEVQ